MKKLLAVITAALICVSCCSCGNKPYSDVTQVPRSELIGYEGTVCAKGGITGAAQDKNGYVKISFTGSGQDWYAIFKSDVSSPQAVENYFDSISGNTASFYGTFDTQRSTRAAKNYLQCTSVVFQGREITPDTQFDEPTTQASTEKLTETPTQAPTETPTEEPTEAPTETPTEATVGTKIYEDNKFIFYFVKTEPSYDDLNTYFTVENKTKDTYLIQCDYITLNKKTYNFIILSDYVQGNTQSLIDPQINDDFVDTNLSVASAGGQFRLYNQENGEYSTIKIPDTKI